LISWSFHIKGGSSPIFRLKFPLIGITWSPSPTARSTPGSDRSFPGLRVDGPNPPIINALFFFKCHGYDESCRPG